MQQTKVEKMIEKKTFYSHTWIFLLWYEEAILMTQIDDVTAPIERYGWKFFLHYVLFHWDFCWEGCYFG